METQNLASRGIVQELLTIDNYERWKTLMKNYLMGKDLWATVTSDYDAPDRKNAEALHIIQVSCEPKIFNEISRFEKAKEAWDWLGWLYDPEIQAKPDIEKGVVVDIPDDDYRKLYECMNKGDWTAVKSLIDHHPNVLFSVLDSSGRTILHSATMAGHENMVNGLVRRGMKSLVRMKDRDGYTALSLAAHYTGNTHIAKCMTKNMEKELRNELLAMSTNKGDEIPVLLAAGKGHKEMTRYLYAITPSSAMLNESNNFDNRVLPLLERCLKAQIFDVAEKLLDSYPDLPTDSWCKAFRALSDLAQMPSVFLSGSQFGSFQKFIYDILTVEKPLQNSGEIHHKTNFLGIREIYEQKCSHDQLQKILGHFRRKVPHLNDSQLSEASVYDAMLHAAKHGIVEFIDAMKSANHNLLWVIDKHKRDMLSYAVLHRKQDVFHLILTLSGSNYIFKYRKDLFGNNLLHLAGNLGPSSYRSLKTGAALQLQSEIQWFKAVEQVVNPICKEEKNNDGKKPRELFTETHEELVKDGEKWIKETFNYFTVVGTLITAIMFAAAITIPGGNRQDTGVPIFLNVKLFTVFLVADAISVFTSTGSVVMFIVVLTSRFTENDFLNSLPLKLLLGVFFLCLSVVAMMVAFCAALAIILKDTKEFTWLLMPAIIFSCFLAVMLVRSPLRIMSEIYLSTISNPIIPKTEKKHMFVYKKV